MLCNMTVIIPTDSQLGSKALSCSPSPGFPNFLLLFFHSLRPSLSLSLSFTTSTFLYSTIDFVFSLGVKRL